MLRNVTNIILATLLLSTTIGFFMSNNKCDFSSAEAMIYANHHGCCTEHIKIAGYSDYNDANPVCDLQNHMDNCKSHSENGCSCSEEPGAGSYIPVDVLVDKKISMQTKPSENCFVPCFEGMITKHIDIQIAKIICDFSLPRKTHDIRVEYGVFLC